MELKFPVNISHPHLPSFTHSSLILGHYFARSPPSRIDFEVWLPGNKFVRFLLTKTTLVDGLDRLCAPPRTIRMSSSPMLSDADPWRRQYHPLAKVDYVQQNQLDHDRHRFSSLIPSPVSRINRQDSHTSCQRACESKLKESMSPWNNSREFCTYSDVRQQLWNKSSAVDFVDSTNKTGAPKQHFYKY